MESTGNRMADHASFLAAIREAPEDDTPRLVYADWLDDQGDAARAEFIRIQCERARLHEGEARDFELRWREEQLLADHGEEWSREVPAWARKECTFRRGFVDSVQ